MYTYVHSSSSAVHQPATSCFTGTRYYATGLRSYARIFRLPSDQSASLVAGVFPISLLAVWKASNELDDISDAREQ